MTRRKQKKRIAVVVVFLIMLIALALFSKLLDSNTILAKLYDFIKDTSLLVATVSVAYLANIYQRRGQFLQSLREQWREIVEAKGALIFYCQSEAPSHEEYFKAARQLSECIDTMRIVYCNVGETEDLIGMYPYEPLHDMRRLFETLNPAKYSITNAERLDACQKIWEAFFAIREHFLDEFDLEEPTRPILVPGTTRLKKPGANVPAQDLLKYQENFLRQTSQKKK